MKLFGLKASEQARRVADQLGIELSQHEERDFEDGEFKIRPLESVCQEHVFVYHSLAGGAGMSPSDKLCRLLFFVGALKDASAARVSVLAPYLAYARKDRRTKPRDPVTTRYVAQMFEAMGVDEIITVDVHNPAAFENAFRCRKCNLEAASLFVAHFAALAKAAKRLVVVSPDAGGVKRARSFSELLAQQIEGPVDLAFVEKQRSEGRVSGELFAGDVRDATVIVLDDLISGGTTMLRVASMCLERGAHSVHAAATHGVFAREAAANLAASTLASIVVTDTVCDVRSRGAQFTSKLVVIESAPLLAQSVRRPGALG
jgi:ribose-phosphate pyrophosphokinase